MFVKRTALHIHLLRLRKFRLRLAVLLFVTATFVFTFLQRRVTSNHLFEQVQNASDLHITEAAAYDFHHKAEFAHRTIHYFNHDPTNINLLIEKCSVPPVFVSRLGQVGRRRLLAELSRDSNGVLLWRTMPRILVVDLQNGLGNRLRALASAMQFAFLTQRVLVVIWAPDPHIRARLPQLLDPSVLLNLILVEHPVPWPLKESQLVSFGSVADHVPSITHSHSAATSFVYYNFMQKDNGFQGSTDRRIPNHPGQHIYVKTAYLIESQGMGNELLNVFIQCLKPATRVMQLVHSVEHRVGGAHIFRKMVGVHIRGRSIINDNSEVDSECEYSLKGAQITDSWRKLSTPKQFIPEMKRILDEWPTIVKWSDTRSLLSAAKQDDVETSDKGDHIHFAPVDVAWLPKFFVCVDSVSAFEELSKQFPKDSLVSLARKCDDRGAECMMYAFADLVLLSRTGAMLASGWSSFSEVAMRMRIRPHGTHPSSNEGYYVRTSGYDFGKPSYSYWEKLAFRALRIVNKWYQRRYFEPGMTQEEHLKVCEQRRSKAAVK